jgi:transcriptional regulator with XRE-family HTH domain
MDLCSNLQQLMRIHGNLSVSDLARLTDVPQPTLHHILMGATRNPRKKSLEALSSFFSVSTEQLKGNEPLPNIIPKIIQEDLKISTIPIIAWDMLKEWPIPTESLGLKEILLDKTVADHSFGLVVQDSSLEPLFPQNALLIFDFGKKPLDRDFVIVKLEQNEDTLFNRLFTDNHGSYIKQELEDGNANLIKLDQQTTRIIGTLIEVRIQF